MSKLLNSKLPHHPIVPYSLVNPSIRPATYKANDFVAIKYADFARIAVSWRHLPCLGRFCDLRKIVRMELYTIRIGLRKLGCFGLREARPRLRGNGHWIVVLRSDAIVKLVVEEVGWVHMRFWDMRTRGERFKHTSGRPAGPSHRHMGEENKGRGRMSMKEDGAHHRMQLARSSSGFALPPMLLPLQQLRVGCCRSCLPDFHENSGN